MANMQNEAAYVALTIQGATRQALETRAMLGKVLDYQKDSGVKFDGTIPGIPANPDMEGAISVLAQIQAILDANGPALTKAAAMGGQ